MWPGLDGMFTEPHVAVEVDRKAGDDADTEASDVSDAGSGSDDEPARLPGKAMVEAVWKHHFEEARRPSVVVEDEAPPPRRDSKMRSSVETWKHHFEEARRPSSTAFTPGGDEEPSLFVAPTAPHGAEPSPDVSRPPKSACSLFAPAEASDSDPN